MALPLVPLAVGTAVGSLATYLYKDEAARNKVKTAAIKFSDRIKSKFNSKQTVDSEKMDDVESSEKEKDSD